MLHNYNNWLLNSKTRIYRPEPWFWRSQVLWFGATPTKQKL